MYVGGHGIVKTMRGPSSDVSPTGVAGPGRREFLRLFLQ